MVMRKLLSGSSLLLLLHQHLPPVGRIRSRVGREPRDTRRRGPPRYPRLADPSPGAHHAGKPSFVVLGRRRPRLLSAQHLLLLLLQHLGLLFAR